VTPSPGPLPVLLTATWAQSTDLDPDAPPARFQAFVDDVRSQRPAAESFRARVTALAGERGATVRAVETGIGFWPGGAEPTARFALSAGADAARLLARAVAAEFDQDAVQLVWPAPLPGTPDPGLRGEDVQVRYATGDLATAEVLRRLVAAAGVPGGSLVGADLLVDLPADAVAGVHAELAGWLPLVGWTRCTTERCSAGDDR